MQTFLGVVREAWAGTFSCRGFRHTQSDYTAKILENAVQLGLGFDSCLHHCWTVRHTAWSPSYCQNNRSVLECASVSEVCCSCRAAHVSIFLRYRTARKICHTLVRVGSKGKGATGDHKGSCSATIPCNNHAKGTCPRGDKCRFSHASSDSKPGGNGSKDKKANNERDRCKKCGKIPNPPHREKSCPEASSSSAQVVLTSPPASSSSEVAPPGLHAPVNNSANSGNVMALASILRGSSASARATRLATLARSAGYVVRQFFLCSLHVIKPSICPWSCILSQMCMWCVLLTNIS